MCGGEGHTLAAGKTFETFLADDMAFDAVLRNLAIIGLNVHYVADNGWRIVVFDDCGEWDYIDRIEDERGTVLFDQREDAPAPPYSDGKEPDILARLAYYTPSSEVERDCYHWD